MNVMKQHKTMAHYTDADLYPALTTKMHVHSYAGLLVS